MAKSTASKTAKTKNSPRPKVLLIAASVGQVMVIALALAIFSIARGDDHGNVSAGAYQDQLRGQVDTSTGAPISGRDPASQQQTSLLDVASKPTGTGKQTTSSSTTTKTNTGTNTAVAQNGLGANGCYIDYGIQGQECLPAHASSGGTLTCDGVRNHYSQQGIKVTGTDRYHLDTNHDGIACNAGD